MTLAAVGATVLAGAAVLAAGEPVLAKATVLAGGAPVLTEATAGTMRRTALIAASLCTLLSVLEAGTAMLSVATAGIAAATWRAATCVLVAPR